MIVKTVLITGASSGLGYATTMKLAENGFFVFAAARSIKGVFSKNKNIHELEMDITDECSVRDGFNNINELLNGSYLYGLINNAGICIPSPLELLCLSDLRRQLDTNVVGQLLVTQHALPLIRKAKGRIINVTSGLGSIAVPYLGAYSIAQFAKMAFTDVLRRELINSGISVSIIQPGAIDTPIWGKFLTAGQATLDHANDEKRQIYEKSFKDFLKSSIANSSKAATTDEDFSQVILEVLTTKKPATHYYVGDDARYFAEKSKSQSASEIDKWFSQQSPTAP